MAGLVVVGLAASGIALVGASAEAHTPNVSASCSALTVDLKSYAGSKTNDNNKLVVTIDGVAQNTAFGNSFYKVYSFASNSKAHTWRVQVTVSDDQKWNLDKSGTAQPCATPTVKVSATECTVTGGSSDLTASFAGLTSGRSYTAQLQKNGDASGAPQVFTAGATTATLTWAKQAAGATYNVLVYETDNNDVQATSADVTVIGCPGGESDARVSVEQCVAPGQGTVPATVTIDGLVPGRTYIAQASVNGQNIAGAVATFPAGSSSVTVPVPVDTKDITITVSTGGVSVGTVKLDTESCPIIPAAPVVSIAPCTLDAPSGKLTVQSTGLVDGRVYEVRLDGGVADTFTASGDYSTTFPVAAGTHTVKIVDQVAGDAASSPQVSIDQPVCAVTPKIAVTPTECVAPDGQGSLGGTITGTAVGRSYTVTLSSNGKPVTNGTSTVQGSVAGIPVGYDDLKAGETYTLTVVDSDDSDATATTEVTLADCPKNVDVSAIAAGCSATDKTSDLEVTLSDLAPEKEWTVTVATGSDDAWTVVAEKQISTVGAGDGSGSEPQVVTFDGVKNDADYRVIVKDADGVFENSADVTVKDCGVSDEETTPPGDNPSTPPTPTRPQAGGGTGLAATGVDVLVPGLAALLVLQLGIALLAVGAIRRRKARQQG
ncbi:hypothetical protein [Schumannella sp. 10F1B-5-1]|uniref:hypothetical protein n=1 Tax=Schumannella sp. 10F1B-5-1 TaxID=2590780 RepID=UPI0011328E3E|nr:hypothetical protein [Schumannella sp. 10F1B-5-1]TPW73434.1 hypothetical protein FJ658_04350 [Schumannella sp. 10F1B-5-1]